MSFVPGTAALPTSEVELSISCRSLRGTDVLSKSDPMVVVYSYPFGEKRWVEFNRTEVIENNHDPDFTKKTVIQYRFEENQPLLFKVYDVDSLNSRLEDHDYLGEASCSLAQIISAGKVQLSLRNNGSGTEVCGLIVLSAEELSDNTDDVWLQFTGKHLDKKNFLGKSDPFLVFMKAMESGDFNAVHKTEVIKGTLNPAWLRFSIPVRNLCNGDPERTIKVVCYDWNGNGDNELIGEFETTLKELSQGPGTNTTFELINRKKQLKKKDSYKNSGIICLEYLDIRKKYSFLDYLRGGTQINCSFAIDFTGSNGDPTSRKSLHFVSSVPNSYEVAIQAIGNIIKDYDSDQSFPVLGFGACVPPHGAVSHEFFVNFADNPYCKGVEGVLAAYRNCIMKVDLCGPTNFSPVINHVAKFAMAYRDGTNYFILLIITDGVINDMAKTKQAIVSASELPMSIIIVGVGTAYFGSMDKLDSDIAPLTAPNGSRAVRDIVQFVPLCNFLQPEVDYNAAMANLAKEVLAEVPSQLLSYMGINNIVPTPVTGNTQTIILPQDPQLL